MCCSSFCWLQNHRVFLGDGNCCHKHLSDPLFEGTTSWTTGVVRWTRRAELRIHQLIIWQNPWKVRENNVIQSYIGGIPHPLRSCLWRAPYKPSLCTVSGPGIPPSHTLFKLHSGINQHGWKWARIEDVFPIVNGDIPASYVSLPEGMSKLADLGHCFHPLKWGLNRRAY